jgi:hypothetical protein
MQARLRRIARRSGRRRPSVESLKDRAYPSGMAPTPVLGNAPPGGSGATLEVGPMSGTRDEGPNPSTIAVNNGDADASALDHRGNLDFQDPQPVARNDSPVVASSPDQAANDLLGIVSEEQGGGGSVDSSNLNGGEPTSADRIGPSASPSGLDGDSQGEGPTVAIIPGLINESIPGTGLPTRPGLVRRPGPPARGPAVVIAGIQQMPYLDTSWAPAGARVRPIPIPRGVPDVGEGGIDPGWTDRLKGTSPVDWERWERDLRQFLSRVGVLDAAPKSGLGSAGWRFGLATLTALIVAREVASRRGRRARGPS